MSDAGEHTPSWLAFVASMGAGLSTLIGAAIVVMGSAHNNRFLAASMALAAGVMIYVSLVDILGEAIEQYEDYFAPEGSDAATKTRAKAYAQALGTGGFFVGCVLTVLLDALVHKLYHLSGSDDHGHDLPEPVAHNADAAKAGDEKTAAARGDSSDEERALAKPDADSSEPVSRWSLVRMSIITGLAIAIHNFPEGLATFMSMKKSVQSGLPLVVAIAVHNIPEGICVAAPVLLGTRSKWRAFLWGSLSGITEPIGAAVGWLILGNEDDAGAGAHFLYGLLFSLVAGVMTFISFSELIPTAIKYEPRIGRTMLYIFSGMAIMAFSIVMFAISRS